jgi:hypothetical protein
MINRILIALTLLSTCAGAQTLNVRQIDRVVDVRQNSSTPMIEWYNGESVTYNVLVRRANEPVNLPSDTVPVWKAWLSNDLNTLYINATGTLVASGGNEVSVVLAAHQANLPAGTYISSVQLWQGTNYMGIGAQGPLRVIWSPAGESIAYVGTTNSPWIAQDELRLVETNSNHYASATATIYINREQDTNAIAQLVLASNSLYSVSTNEQARRISADAALSNAIADIISGSVSNEVDPIWSAVSNSYLTTAAAQSTYATGSPIYSLTGYATGTPVYAESDPLFVASSNALLTKAQAALLYATGTPIYAVSGLGTDTTARAWALGASNRADAAYVLAANAATGTPIYSVAGLATGTPIYSVAGLATGTPIYSLAGLATGAPIYSVAGLATGTPLYVENNPSLSALSNDVSNAITTGSLALAVANAASNLAAAGISAVVASNSFVMTTDSRGATNGFMEVSNLTIRSTAYGEVVFKNSPNPWSVDAITNRLWTSRYSGGDMIHDRLNPFGGTFNWSTSFVVSVKFWDAANLPDPRNLSAGTNAPAAWTNQPDLLTLSNGLAAASALGTNAQVAASNAQASANSANVNASNALAYIITAGASITGMSASVTNAQTVGSNALSTAQAAQVQASNINAGAWSQIATNHANMSNYAITNADYIAFGTNTIDGTETNAIGIYNGHPSWVKAPGSVRTLASSDNLSSLGIQTTSGFNSSITNYARITPTGYSFPSAWNDSVGNNGDLVRSGTNMAFKSAGVWVRWTVVTNW